jgi:hypothetical protein
MFDGFDHLIKCVELELTYIVLYSCFDTNRIRYEIFKTAKFRYGLQIRHEPNTKLAAGYSS